LLDGSTAGWSAADAVSGWKDGWPETLQLLDAIAPAIRLMKELGLVSGLGWRIDPDRYPDFPALLRPSQDSAAPVACTQHFTSPTVAGQWRPE